MEQALESAVNNAPIWFATLPQERAAILERAAVLMEDQMQSLIGILVREAGKTFSNAIAEVREAVDFLHYYAGQYAMISITKRTVRFGPLVVCISPRNFPLAIFTGQIVVSACRRQQRVGQTGGANSLLIAAQGIEHPAGSGRTGGRGAVAAVPG